MRRLTVLAVLAACAAHPALAIDAEAAGPRRIPCAVGPYDKIGQINAEKVTARLDTRNAQDIRYEYRALLRNPNQAPAEVAPVLDLPGVVAITGQSVVIPPRGTVEVLVGWVPVNRPLLRGAPPSAEEVQRSFTLGECRVGLSAAPVQWTGFPRSAGRG